MVVVLVVVEVMFDYFPLTLDEVQHSVHVDEATH
jgi:hypothetical protein